MGGRRGPVETQRATVDILAAFLDARDAATGEPFGFEELLNQL